MIGPSAQPMTSISSAFLSKATALTLTLLRHTGGLHVLNVPDVPLHCLFPRPGMLFPQILSPVAPSGHPGLRSHVCFSARPFLTFLYNVVPAPPRLSLHLFFAALTPSLIMHGLFYLDCKPFEWGPQALVFCRNPQHMEECQSITDRRNDGKDR